MEDLFQSASSALIECPFSRISSKVLVDDPGTKGLSLETRIRDRIASRKETDLVAMGNYAADSFIDSVEMRVVLDDFLCQ